MIVEGNAREIQRSGLMGERQYGIALSPKIYSMMSDKLYTDRIGSVVREVCSNAWDAQKMKSLATGQPMEPFKVTLPTDLEPHFIVEDTGPGMPDETAQNLYSTLGLSTKENTNDQIGAFGLGSKSPFAVTDTFTVENTYEGVTHYYLCFKAESGLPSLLKTGERKEDRQNGVKVVIPAPGSKYHEYKRALNRQLIVMDPKPIITNREQFDFVIPQKSLETEQGFILSNATDFGLQSRTMYARMGMVLYPVESGQIGLSSTDRYGNLNTIYSKFSYQSALVLEFPIGAIEPLPSREGLTYDDRTKKSIKEKYDLFALEFRKLLRKQVEEQPTPLDSWLKMQEIRNSMNIDLADDGIYNLGFRINNDNFQNVFPHFDHIYEVDEPIGLEYETVMNEFGDLETIPKVSNKPTVKRRVNQKLCQFHCEEFSKHDTRLNRKRDRKEIKVSFNFLQRIKSKANKFLVMDELEPKHRIGRMKSVLNSLSYNQDCFVVYVNPNYNGSKIDFSEFIAGFERLHPGITSEGEFIFLSNVPRPEVEKKLKDTSIIEGVCYADVRRGEQRIRWSEIEDRFTPSNVYEEDTEEDEWTALIEKGKQEYFNKAFYVRAMRNDLIDYPGYSIKDFSELANSLGYEMLIVRKSGEPKLSKLREIGYLEFKEFISKKLDGWEPSDDYKRYNSAKDIEQNNPLWWRYSTKHQLNALYKELQQNHEWIHPFIKTYCDIDRLADLSDDWVNVDNNTAIVDMLRRKRLLSYLKDCDWLENIDVDLSEEFENQSKEFTEFYPVFHMILKYIQTGQDGLNKYLYQYVVDYNTLKDAAQPETEEDLIDV